MSQPSRPSPEARLLGEEEPALEKGVVWVYEGALERFTPGGGRFPYRQRIHYPHEPAWEEVRALGLWMVERLSINGHLLIGLRARPEGRAPDAARAITPE